MTNKCTAADFKCSEHLITKIYGKQTIGNSDDCSFTMILLSHLSCSIYPPKTTQFFFAQLLYLSPPFFCFILYISLLTFSLSTCLYFQLNLYFRSSLLVSSLLASSNLLYHTNLDPVLPSLCVSVHSSDNFSKPGTLLVVYSSKCSQWVHYFDVLCRHVSTRLRYLSSSETCASVKDIGENTTRQTNG